MYWTVYGATIVAIVGGMSINGFSQEASGPPTLENLLQDGNAAVPARSGEIGAAKQEPQTVRPAGTFVRPLNGSKQSDLDKAWACYDEAVGKATAALREAITNERMSARKAGDLAAATQYKSLLETLDRTGALPAEKTLKKPVSDAQKAYEVAASALKREYRAVVEKLIKDTTLDESVAEAVQRELTSLIAQQTLQEVGRERPAAAGKEGKSSVAPKAGAVHFNGHAYRFLPVSVSWDQAKQQCEEMGGHLVTLETREENEFLTRMLKTRNPQGRCWIGASRHEGAWVWVNGEPVKYTNWSPSEPSNTNGSNWIMMRGDGSWEDFAARHGPCPFVCEWDD